MAKITMTPMLLHRWTTLLIDDTLIYFHNHSCRLHKNVRLEPVRDSRRKKKDPKTDPSVE